jgi:hypothetical protein
MKFNKIFLFLFLGMFLLSFVSAYDPHKIGEDLEFSFTSDKGTSCGVTQINTPYGVISINQESTKDEQTFNNTILSGNFTKTGIYQINLVCIDSGGNYANNVKIIEVTPSGTPSADSGVLSVGILYFFAFIAVAFLFLGFLFLKSKSVWIKYTGLFIMILGFTFLYYDFHLSNLYAQTIASNSGASTTTSGAFVLITRFLKLAPYVTAGIVAFASIKVLSNALKKKRNNDGWDNNAY